MLGVLPGDLEAGLIRLGAGIDEIGVVVAAHEGVDLLAELGGGQVHGGVRVIGDGLHLLGGDLRQFGAAIADIDAPEPGHGVEIGGAIGIDDGGALRARHHHLLLFQRLVLQERVEDVVEVLFDDLAAGFGVGLVGEGHWRFLRCGREMLRPMTRGCHAPLSRAD